MVHYQVKLNREFVGRELEQEKLLEIAANKSPSIVVVHGRRRVGKTELIEQTFRKHHLLKFEGRENQREPAQREVFLETLSRYYPQADLRNIDSSTWRGILLALADQLERKPGVVFFEEFQWMCDYQEVLISELKYIWDNRLRHIPKLLLIVCGSSPSFMIKKVVYSKALYNRSVHEICVKPFALNETRLFLGERFSNRSVLDAHLSVGGIPEYLKYIKQEKAVIPGLVRNSFLPNAYFATEKQRVFVSSLAENPHYQRIINFLSKRKFATRIEIAKHLKVEPGGNLSKLLEDLNLCGFIDEYSPLGKKSNSKTLRHRIADSYLQFYFRFIEPRLSEINKGTFAKTPGAAFELASFEQFLGFAFERWCLSASPKIAEVLGFSGIHYQSGVLFSRPKSPEEEGWQVDLAFQRADSVLTLCELKHTTRPINVADARKALARFDRAKHRAQWSIQRVLIATNGVVSAVRNGPYFDRIIELEELF